MLEEIKKILYFPLAWYFRIFASVRLKRWNPQIIVVTGSNGKTTLLHLLEAQIGEKAKYSHHANSSYGVPFDILGLHRTTLHYSEWITLFLKSPFFAFKKPPKEKLYIVEADADRPGEGKFLAEFLKPEIVLWTNTAKTHSMYFERLASFATVDEAIAYEYGYFLENCSKLAVINGDLPRVLQQMNRTKAEVKKLQKKDVLETYAVTKKGATFGIDGKHYHFSYLLPEEAALSISMCKEAVERLSLPFDSSFKHFVMPPGRGTVFTGVKNTTLIDSTYNANLGSITAILAMFERMQAKKKWVVIGDMMELGEEEKSEHKKLASVLEKMELEKIILVGERVTKYTYPLLATGGPVATAFISQKETLDYLIKNIQGEEIILFKGSQSLYLEGIIEQLVKDKKDVLHLPRRGTFWNLQRKKKGL